MSGSLNVTYAQSADAGVFAVVKLSNPGDFIAKTSQFAEKLQPGMGAMINSMMVGQMVFKNPNWAGMDLAGEYTAVVLNPMMYPQSPVALIAPVTSKDEYLGILSQSLTGGEEMEGIHSFTQPNQRGFFAAFTGDTAILGEDTNVVTQVKALVEANDPILTEVSAVKGQLAAFLPVSKILTAVRPMIDGFRQMMMSGMGQGMPQGEGAQSEGAQPEGEQPESAQPPIEPIKNILQAEIDMLLSLLEQTEKLQLGVDVQPEEGLRLSKAVFPVEGSNVAKFLMVQSPQKSSLLGFIPADSAIVGSGSIKFTPEFIAGYAEFTKAISSAASETDPAMADKMAQWTRDILEAFGGDFAFGALGQSEEALVTEVFTLKDTAKTKQLVEQYPEMMQSMAGMYKGFGLDFNMNLAGKEAYKGGEIFDYNFGLKAEAIADPEGQEAFNKIFGDELTMPIGFVGNYSVLGLGKNARGQVQKVMELLDSGADVSAQYTPAMFGLPEENNMFMYLSLPKIVKWAAKYAPEAPAFEIPDGPGVAMSARFVESHFEGELFVPTEEILAIMTLAPHLHGRVEETEPAEPVAPPTQ
jgi:hypothetical protein